MKKQIKKSLSSISVLAFIAMASITIVGCSDKDEAKPTVVEFADAELLDIIKETLNITADVITDADLKNLITLDLRNSGVASISGLEKAENLEEFIAAQTEIGDLSPLSGLVKLRVVDLDRANVAGNSSISFLANLNNLEHLNLRNARISDISLLAGKSKLVFLHLRESDVSDISPLANMTQLQYLNLNRSGSSEGGIKDVTIVAPFHNLYYLSLRNSTIGDENFKMFEKFTKLVEANIRNTGVTDISPLVKVFEAGGFSQTLSDQFGNKISLDLQQNAITNPCVIAQWVGQFPEGELEGWIGSECN